MLLWNKPYLIKDNNNEEVVVLLMDTQGLFDNKSTVQQCVTVFAMSTLISSIQIFNISQQIQENDLQHLRLFTEYAQMAKKNSTATPFQKLMFLVRDWQNSNEHSYGYYEGDDYLENLLETTGDQEEELRLVRQNLKSSFDEMSCYLMPHPGSRIAKNHSDKLLGEMDEEFQEHVGLFEPEVFGQIEPKKIKGQTITCADLFNLFKVYMGVFKSGKLPRPRSILEATAQALNTAAEECARNEYDRLMDEILSTDPYWYEHSKLEDCHKNSKEIALKMYDSKPKLGNADITEKYKESLLKGIEKRFTELSEQVEIRRKAKEEEERIAEERRKIAEAELKIEEERQRQHELRKMEEERLKQADEARRREEQLKAEKEMQDEFYRRERERMDNEKKTNRCEYGRNAISAAGTARETAGDCKQTATDCVQAQWRMFYYVKRLIQDEQLKFSFIIYPAYIKNANRIDIKTD